MAKPQKVHFIGICGVAMSAVATALREKGYKVTGSDAGFFPPVSTHLDKLGIPYYAGWHPEKMIADGTPDFVVVGNAIATQNPELAYVEEHGVPFKSYPEAVGEFIIKKNSIVAAGTYGKTTSSALLTHILRRAGREPSYMIGGLTQDGLPSAAIDSGEWSVVEGDEYTSAKWDQRPKFAHYKPTHLLLTAVKWDHADIYKTEESYFEAFRGLIRSVPKEGMIVACIDDDQAPKMLAEAGRDFISYGTSSRAKYRYEDVFQSERGLAWSVIHGDLRYDIESPLLGKYNAENATGCFALAREIGIAPEEILEAIRGFRGMKRRLEKRLEAPLSGGTTVIDDIAHSPEKARSVLKNLREIYSGKVIAVYEPNTGNRTPESVPSYKNAFRDADMVVIPKLTRLKVDSNEPEKTFDGEELTSVIGKSHKNAVYLEDDEALVSHITEKREPGDVIAFLGSHGFRGMIEETVKRLQ
ncbi:MAG: Mur ligase family protein [Minisyncoccia bacterium]|jgi:UDP-N-acetylmuramate: L-alanyl-gamma-D-glutamyl-meso-diaminopimelate ligase